HYLDWANQPLPFKIYPDLEPIKLPRDVPQTGVTALSAISQGRVAPSQDTAPTLRDLARLLHLSAGITKARTYSGREFYFRAAACTGALYEIELYIVCGDLPGLEAGLYHFGAAEFALRLLRKGDFRGNLAHATANEQAIAHAPATIICTGTYWRNAWKYQARTYRHFGWDNGTLLANMLAIATARSLPARVVMGFVDDDVNHLLDLETEREVAFSVMPIGWESEPAPASFPDIRPLGLETIPLSRSETDYPLMRETHAASSLVGAEEVRAWRETKTPST